VPTYQYACTVCDERLEVVQRFTDDPLTECPVCGERLRKVFSPVGVVFKGSGFYRTDSRGKPKADAASEAGGAKADAGSKADSGSKADAKPDTAGSKTDTPAKTAGKPNGSAPSTAKKAGSAA